MTDVAERVFPGARKEHGPEGENGGKEQRDPLRSFLHDRS